MRAHLHFPPENYWCRGGEGVVSLEYKADECLKTFHLAELEMKLSGGVGDYSTPQSREGVCR